MIDLLKTDDISSIPTGKGAYVLGANSNVQLVYPWGSSPVFFVGQSSNLQKRIIGTHRKLILAAFDDHTEKNWWPRYQYGAAHGAIVAWYSCRGLQDPNKLESDLITSFYDNYGSIPVANGTWPTGLRKSMSKNAEGYDE